MMRSQVGARYEAEHYKDEMHIQQLVIQAKYPGIHGEPGTPFIDPDAPDEDQSDEAQESADVETSVDGIQTAEEELATDALAGVAFADEAAQGRN